jgi:hypothetical protein
MIAKDSQQNETECFFRLIWQLLQAAYPLRIYCLSPQRLCHNTPNLIDVMLSKAKHLAFSGCYKVEILRLRLRMTLRHSNSCTTGTTRRMKMIALRCRRPMTSGRSETSALSLHTVGPEYSKETLSVAAQVGKARIRESSEDEYSFGRGVIAERR